MFCNKCGAEVGANEKFCSKCGESVLNINENTEIETPDEVIENVISEPVTLYKPKKSKKKIFIIGGAVAAVVIAAIAIVVALIVGENTNKKGYIGEVEAYLDYISDKNKDTSDFCSDAYFCGSFGEFYSGEEAAKTHEMILENMFGDMSGGMVSYYGYDDEGSWEDYFEEAIMGDFYHEMDRAYGDWDLSYEIGEAEKLSDAKIERLQNKWDDVIDCYEDYKKEVSDKSDKDDLKEFIESIEELQVKKAYEVEVKVEIDGKKESLDESVDFVVAEIGGEWVIMEGIGFDELLKP